MRLLTALLLVMLFGVSSFAQEQSLGEVARQYKKKKLAYQTEIDVVAETDDISMGPYLGQLMTRIREKWLDQLPPQAKQTDCLVTVQFAVSREGKPSDVQLVESCKNAELESAALAGINSAAPFPAIPQSFRPPQLWVRVNFQHHAANKEQRATTRESSSGSESAAQ